MNLFLTILVLAGCASNVKVAPITVQPIHMTVDVNVHDQAAPATGSVK